MRPKKWNEDQLTKAVAESSSIRQILKKLDLKAAGGNYLQVNKYINQLGIDTLHLTGKGWRKFSKTPIVPKIPISELLKEKSNFQSYKLKRRLIEEKIKNEACEICGWAQKAEDGRIPLELDHINGEHMDNRIENLRILCPNCHSLQSTHRGRNKSRK